MEIDKQGGVLQHPTLSKEQVFKLRRKFFSSSLSVSYANTDPLMVMCGDGCYLTATESTATSEATTTYLDTRNNVAHVGHCNPTVVEAVQQQVSQLNTNSRYLHPNIVLLAEQLLTEWFPPIPNSPDPPLKKVFFVNSGSEANDLALRLARAYNQDPDAKLVVVDRAYHGHTLGTLTISPYKYHYETEPIHEALPMDRIAQVPCPDVYRGDHRDAVTAGQYYAKFVEDVCGSQKVRAMIMEGGMSVAGGILPPNGYLRRCITAVRKAGGVFIADEVQTGLGRLGAKYPWAFQYQDAELSSSGRDSNLVTPDIVTIGKPFGNGMPLAAVVVNEGVAAAFEKCGIEYFNTFGGNPVCAAAGLAVLKVLRDERLPERAEEAGAYLKKQLLELQQRHVPLIGDVRGSGLFWGIELVRNQETREPATAETSFICSRLKDKYHILTSVDGTFDNVIVMKPPMVFGLKEVDHFVDAFKKVVTEDLRSAGEKVQSMKRTPT